ncbi:glycine oxidase ThiO [Corynebacterium terpenotabidum]|uniref:glycine oxidase n=1 Tax=Corynebacterium terpenotabidum Y-11 TaxID=1200352 RepID=S4XIV5_9CORY|nr:glycine oxidase ThiO [Corynebacterium terpenotabidum]AGP30528.1 glycine oxidase [Corynebacterium terpenotabidum Y-11]
MNTVIVGAGVAGLTAAWNLHKAGQSVTVVDPTPGHGASFAAAGMIAAVSEVVYQHETMRGLMTASAAMYPGLVAELEEVLGHGVGFRGTETLDIGAHPADRDTFADLAELQRSSGMTVERLTVREARRLEPALSPTIAGAFLVHDDHQIDPRVLVPSLIEALTTDGRSSVVHRRVTDVLRDGTAVTGVRLDDGSEILADTTLLCPGVALAGINGLPEAEGVRLRPVHGDILRARVRPGRPPLIDRTVRGLVDGRPVYLVPRTDGEIVIGATEREDGFDGVVLEGAYQLLRDAQVLVPGAADLELTEILARARPGTPDDLPCLGHLAGVDNLVVSTGYSRHGILLAPLGGRLAADLVLGTALSAPDAAILAATDPRRFSGDSPRSPERTTL